MSTGGRKPRIQKFTFKANLKWLLSTLDGGEETCVEVLRQVPEDDPDFEAIQRVLAHWDGQNGGAKPSLDLACTACQVQAAMLYGWFAKTCFSLGLNIMKTQLAAASPAIMQAAIEKALTPDGTADRKILFEANGLLQQRRGVAVQQNFNLPAAPDDNPDAFEHGQRDITARLRDRTPMKQIPSTIDVVKAPR